MDLLDLRNEIDDIDEQLIPLLKKRMNISKQVAEYKVKSLRRCGGQLRR